MEIASRDLEPFPRQDISGFVLAGGRSSRLGKDKVLLPWNGQTLLDHAIARLQTVCQSVRLCGDRADLWRQSVLLAPDAWTADAVPGAGPLGGIVAALENTPTDWNFFLAVDLPLVPVAMLRAIAVSAAGSRAETLCVLPEVEALPQPLCGIYHRRLAPGLRRALMEGKFKIMLALRESLADTQTQQSTGSRSVAAAEKPGERARTSLDFFDVERFAARNKNASRLHAREWFVNINTPEDWRRARELS